MSDCKHGVPLYGFCKECCRDINHDYSKDQPIHTQADMDKAIADVHKEYQDEYNCVSKQMAVKLIADAKRETTLSYFPALEMAMALCDAVPTKLQNHKDEYVANIGQLVNEQGYYHTICSSFQDAKEAIKEAASE